MPIAVRPSDVDLAEYMDKEQSEAWINEWTQNHATDRSGKMLRLFLQHEFKVDIKESMKPCNGCDQLYSSFLLMPMLIDSSTLPEFHMDTQNDGPWKR